MTNAAGYVGIDLDGTLAHYETWSGVEEIGEPIPAMVDYVKSLLNLGVEVRIFTARHIVPGAKERKKGIKAIKAWCLKHIGQELYVTNEKDMGMIFFVDDRSVTVQRNTGVFLVEPPGIDDIANHWNAASAPPMEEVKHGSS